MKILAIDTSQNICSVALANDEKIIASKTDYEPSRQAERLFLIIDEMLKENNFTYCDINLIAANIGPGSFTGIRIGLAAARGAALAAKIPLIGVSTFEALADGVVAENKLIVLDAKRGQVFAQFFKNEHSSAAKILDYADITSVINEKSSFELIGDGADFIENFLHVKNLQYARNSKITLSDAQMIASVTFKKYISGNYNTNPAPLYIRPPDAKLPGGREVEIKNEN